MPSVLQQSFIHIVLPTTIIRIDPVYAQEKILAQFATFIYML